MNKATQCNHRDLVIPRTERHNIDMQPERLPPSSNAVLLNRAKHDVARNQWF